MFSELRRPDEDLLETPFGGRFCGMIAPRPRISLYNSLVLGFYTDQNSTDGDLFYGTYQFINACETLFFSLVLSSICRQCDSPRKGMG